MASVLSQYVKYFETFDLQKATVTDYIPTTQIL